MISLSNWISQPFWTERTWLILGKGPSFARIKDIDLSQYHTISLNHAVREVPVDVAHFIDLEALEESADAIRNHARWLIVPQFPHVDFQPADEPLEIWLDRIPVLREFSDQNRLVCYCHVLGDSGMQVRYPLSNPDPLIPVTYFSAEAVVRILAAMGVRTVRTLGVDGGGIYNSRFNDLDTCLKNGQATFDRQFISIYRTVKETNMDYGPLDEPMRVYVETDPSTLLPFHVLAYSIRKFASRPVEIIPIDRTMVPSSKIFADDAGTAVSLARFLIPQLSGYRGKAIYLQAGMLVFGDMAELWEVLTPVHSIQICERENGQMNRDESSLRPEDFPGPGVMLLDCDKLNWDIHDILQRLENGGVELYELLSSMSLETEDLIGFDIPLQWNSREHFSISDTRLMHFADAESQPWRSSVHPFRNLWLAFFREAIEVGAVDERIIENALQAGHISEDYQSFLDLAPARRSAADAALSGTHSVHSRRRELERVALAAELDVLHENHMNCRSYVTQLEASLQATEGALRATETALGATEASLSATLGQLADQMRTIETLAAQLNSVQQEKSALSAQLDQHILAYKMMMSSVSFRIGRTLTKPARLIRSLGFGKEIQDAA